MHHSCHISRPYSQKCHRGVSVRLTGQLLSEIAGSPDRQMRGLIPDVPGAPDRATGPFNSYFAPVSPDGAAGVSIPLSAAPSTTPGGAALPPLPATASGGVGRGVDHDCAPEGYFDLTPRVNQPVEPCIWLGFVTAALLAAVYVAAVMLLM